MLRPGTKVVAIPLFSALSEDQAVQCYMNGACTFGWTFAMKADFIEKLMRAHSFNVQ